MVLSTLTGFHRYVVFLSKTKSRELPIFIKVYNSGFDFTIKRSTFFLEDKRGLNFSSQTP